jgi:hypothetical protein
MAKQPSKYVTAAILAAIALAIFAASILNKLA